MSDTDHETNETSEFWHDWRTMRKDQHEARGVENKRIVIESEIPCSYRENGIMLFREKGKPDVDFYSTTGRWRIPQQGKTYSGGAKKFLEWYKKQ